MLASWSLLSPSALRALAISALAFMTVASVRSLYDVDMRRWWCRYALFGSFLLPLENPPLSSAILTFVFFATALVWTVFDTAVGRVCGPILVASMVGSLVVHLREQGG